MHNCCRFCPGGTFPETGCALHPNGNPNKCLDVHGAVFASGTPVQMYLSVHYLVSLQLMNFAISFDCNETNVQKWIINCANTKVCVAGTNSCLDAGTCVLYFTSFCSYFDFSCSVVLLLLSK